MQPNENAQGCLVVFLLGGGIFVFYVLNVFPSSFQSVSQVLNATKTFPIAFHF